MPIVFAKDFIEVLEKKYASGTYKEMVSLYITQVFVVVDLYRKIIEFCLYQVIYLESCESGSIFEGLLKENMNIYVTTASNAEESSWGTYCPDMKPPPPPEYDTCLGDLYSVAWMEDRYGFLYCSCYTPYYPKLCVPTIDIFHLIVVTSRTLSEKHWKNNIKRLVSKICVFVSMYLIDQ